MEKLEVSYVPHLPLQGHCPRVFVHGEPNKKYVVKFYDGSGEKVWTQETQNNTTIIGERQWYTNWRITLESGGKIIDEDIFNLKNKTVFIKIDGYALGDNLAWIPYVEEFRKKHNCQVICSSFFNQLFAPSYPHILFVKPNIDIDNIYAQYFIGAGKEGHNIKYSPTSTKEIPLQKTACDILGLKYQEVRPKVVKPNFGGPSIKGKYVTISEFASADFKMWNGNWQTIVNHLKSLGYKVVVISKEPTSLTGIIDKTGDLRYIDRINDLTYAEFHIGVSSALSWLSWATGTHVFMISDFTPPSHEFQSGVTRLYDPKFKKSVVVNFKPKHQISTEKVISKINEYLK